MGFSVEQGCAASLHLTIINSILGRRCCRGSSQGFIHVCASGLLEPCFDLKFLVSAAYVFAVAAGKGDFPHSAGVKSAASLLKMPVPGSIYSRALEVVVAKLAGADSFSRGLVVGREGARLSH
jgi:hypothetical protein